MRRLQELIRVFLPGLELKRWLLVVLAGLLNIVIGSYLWLGDSLRRARGNPLVKLLTLGFLPRFPRGLTYLGLGSLMTLYGWQRLSRSLVRVMLPDHPEAELGQVILERQRAERGRRVVVIGGDPGLTPVLEALKFLKESVRIDVILPATEPGYRAQELQNKFGLSAPQLIYPTTDDTVLYAELEDGRLLEGVTTINRYSGGRITSVFLSRDIRRVQVWESEQNGKGLAARLRDYMPNVSEAALDALHHAELIILAPGRIYTQVLPNLMLPRLAQAVQESKATKVYIANLMTEPGRTDGWTIADHLETIHDLSGVSINYAIVHQGSISSKMLQQYHNEGADVVRTEPEEGATSRLIFADTGEETVILEGAVIVAGDLVTEAPQMVSFQRGEDTIIREMPVVRHDPSKIAPILHQLLREEL